MRDNTDSVARQPPCVTEKLDKAGHGGFGWSSRNWSAFLARTGKKGAYQHIAAVWTVPFVQPAICDAYSSVWIGIDGFLNTKLIQVGTGHDTVNGKACYYAWWEVLPASQTVIKLPVYPGDRIRASISKQGPNRWLIVMNNRTAGWIFRIYQPYTGPQTSAEWIVEAPQVGERIARLARLSPVSFAFCRVNGKNARLSRSEGGVMIQHRRIVSAPAHLHPGRSAFMVKASPSR